MLFLRSLFIVIFVAVLWTTLVMAGRSINYRIRREEAKNILVKDLDDIRDTLNAALASGDVYLRDKVQYVVQLLDELKPLKYLGLT